MNVVSLRISIIYLITILVPQDVSIDEYVWSIASEKLFVKGRNSGTLQLAKVVMLIFKLVSRVKGGAD